MESEILALLKEIQRNLVISWKDWMPLISTVTGGIIALVGSVGVQFIQARLAKKKEVYNHLREKLETIGNLSNEFEKALQIDMAQLYGVAAPNDTNIAPVHEKLQILLLNVKLYHDKLSDAADNLEKACLNYLNEKRDIKNKQMTKIITQLSDVHLKQLIVEFDHCLVAKRALLEKVVNEANHFKIN